MKKIFVLACALMFGFSTFAKQDADKVKKEKSKTEMKKESPDGKQKMDDKKDKTVKTKDMGDAVDKTEVTKETKHTRVPKKGHHATMKKDNGAMKNDGVNKTDMKTDEEKK